MKCWDSQLNIHQMVCEKKGGFITNKVEKNLVYNHQSWDPGHPRNHLTDTKYKCKNIILNI